MSGKGAAWTDTDGQERTGAHALRRRLSTLRASLLDDRPRPPGPSDRLGIQNALRLQTGTLPLLRDLVDRHGDVVYMKLLGTDYYVLNHPRDIEQALVEHAAIMGRDEYTETLVRTLGRGLLTSDGELWKRQRKLMAQAFTPRRIRDYGDTMVAVADGCLRPPTFTVGEVVDIHELMGRVTLEVVAAVLFGTAVSGEEIQVVAEAMGALNRYYANSPEAVLMLPRWVPTPLNRLVNDAVERLDTLIYAIIGRARAQRASASGQEQEGPRDLLATLIAASDEGGAGMSDQQLRDEAMTLFLAGHETTALALAHALYLLAKHPEIEAKLQAELAEVLPGDRLPTTEDAKALLYTRRVLDETMRLYPPAWAIGREVLEEVEIAGYRIPAGAQLLISQWLVHRDPRFFPDPEAFDPDRWLPERAKQLPRYAFFPFGGGPRVCIGNHFAMLEATLLLAMIVQRAHLELMPGQRLELLPSVTLRPKGPGLRARVHPRRAGR
ncbi:MAG: cytochrome P450 [Myxococcales bacterium]|nr:cytochrome P450 [Myxococcales bacterium]